MSHFDDKEREVVLSAACDRLPDFEPAGSENEEFVGDEFVDRIAWALPNEPFRPRAGRNEPCPCGSGRKYKKCHLRTDEAEHAEGRRATATHEMDARLLGDLRNFATREFGEEWRRFQDDLATESDSIFLTYPLSVFSFEANGTTVVDAYLTAHGRRCTAAERDWLEAQRAAWLSVWEVEAVEAGRSLTLRDLLSGERRTVLERSASKIVVVRDALLARVVDHDGLSLLAGIHSGVLNPFEAHDVVDRARRRLRRKRDVPVERLRDAAFGRALIRYWIDALEELRIRRSLPRELRNRDGDLLTQTVDRFEVLPGTMTEIGRIIAQLEGFIEEGAEDGAATYVFLGAMTERCQKARGRSSVSPGSNRRRCGPRRTPKRGPTRCGSASRRHAAPASDTARESRPIRTRSAQPSEKRRRCRRPHPRTSDLPRSTRRATTRSGPTCRCRPWARRRRENSRGQPPDAERSICCSSTWRTWSNAPAGPRPSTSRSSATSLASRRAEMTAAPTAHGN